MLCNEAMRPVAGKEVPEMIIDCAHYQDGRRRDEGPVPLEEAAARCGQGGFVWLGLFEPGDEELAQVRDTFGLHELAAPARGSRIAVVEHNEHLCRTRRSGWQGLSGGQVEGLVGAERRAPGVGSVEQRWHPGMRRTPRRTRPPGCRPPGRHEQPDPTG